MKQLINLLLLLLTIPAVSAQSFGNNWYPGFVELRSGELHEGIISFYSDFKNSLLQVQKGDNVLTYDGSQVSYFHFFDTQLGGTRTFYSLLFQQQKTGIQNTMFLESLLEGEHLLVLSLREYRPQKRKIRNPRYVEGFSGQHMGNTQYVDYFNRDPRWLDAEVQVPYETLYLVTPSTFIQPFNAEPTAMEVREIVYLRPNPELLFKLVKDKKREINAYIKQNKLDVRRRTDLLQLVQYYNALKDQVQN